MVQSKLAEMATRAQAARLLTYRAAEKCDQGKPFETDAAYARYFAAQSAVVNTTDGIQIHGGYGYTKDYPAERFFRDCQFCEVLCGAPFQDREFIARKIIG
jgi:alkylation response protein AidB-like acyl-CoA dehydrogenase